MLTADHEPHWLQRLGMVRPPEGTVLSSAELSLRGIVPWWLALIAILAGAAGAYYVYRRENAQIGPFRRLVLTLLRATLIALVVILLLRPVLLAEFHGQRPRDVVLLVDSSQSMSQADRRISDRDRIRLAIARGLLPPGSAISDTAPLARLPAEGLADIRRIDLVRAVLGNDQLDLLRRLQERGTVQSFLVDRQLHSPDQADALASSLRADGSRTALADGIHEILQRFAGELPSAIVVMSDGHDNASKRTLDEVAQACRDRKVPLHVYGTGSTESGILQLKEVRLPPTVFVDPKPDVKDDLVEIPVRFRARGFKKGTLVLTAKLGDRVVTERFPLVQGENLTRIVRIEPAKGKEGDRPVEVSLKLEGVPGVGDEVRKVVPVRSSRVKVLYVENTPRREYRFIQPVLDRDRRVLLRVQLVEGDPALADAAPDRESGSLFLSKFPDTFPEPHPRDPDRRPYDLLILGDVPFRTLGEGAAREIQQFVKEGGGLVMLAGPHHSPAELVGTPLAEVLPVEFDRVEFTSEEAARATSFRPVLTHDGENSTMLALADRQEENLALWKEGLWKNVPGFWWHYPVLDLRPGATALVVHPDKKTARKDDRKPMPVVATHYYGKGEVLFLGSDETWRWRDSTGDRLTARFWGQIVARLGLPHLLGARRTQLDLERGGAVLGLPGALKARFLDPRYEPVVRPEIRATLVNLDAMEESARSREVKLRRIPGQPGEYRGALPNDVAGKHELHVTGVDGLESATLPFLVELPPRHEQEVAGLAEETLAGAAATSGGAFYREEDLHRLPDAVPATKASFTLRQEQLLWNPLAMGVFILLITAEWLVRKFSNLS